MYTIPKFVAKLWGSNKSGLGLTICILLGLMARNSPPEVRMAAMKGMVIVVCFVIGGNALEDAAGKLGK